MQQNEMKHGSICVFEDIYCTVLIRVDKMGFHRRYDFIALSSDNFPICNDWGDAVEWSEIFSAFGKNALIKKVRYRTGIGVVFNFDNDNGPPKLCMHLSVEGCTPRKYTFSKLECMQIYSKMSKILSKCDLVSRGL